MHVVFQVHLYKHEVNEFEDEVRDFEDQVCEFKIKYNFRRLKIR
jgi:hypothetical protein